MWLQSWAIGRGNSQTAFAANGLVSEPKKMTEQQGPTDQYGAQILTDLTFVIIDMYTAFTIDTTFMM